MRFAFGIENPAFVDFRDSELEEDSQVPTVTESEKSDDESETESDARLDINQNIPGNERIFFTFLSSYVNR